MNRATFVVAGLLLAFAAFRAEGAEGSYPNRPIRFIVPFAAGGPSDILARLVGKKLHESMGQPLIIDNRGSVGGILAFELGARIKAELNMYAKLVKQIGFKPQ